VVGEERRNDIDSGVVFGNSGAANYKVLEMHGNGNIYVETDMNTNFIAICPYTEDGEWHHHAIVTQTGAQAICYEDGIVMANLAAAAAPLAAITF